MSKTSHVQKGLQLAAIAAIISGVSIFINKFAVGMISSPLVFTATKNSFVGILILAYVIQTKKIRQFTSLTRSQLQKLALIGIIGGSIPFYLFFTGLAHVSAVNAALIQKTLIFWVVLLAIPLLKERLSMKQFISICILFYANTLIGGFKGFTLSSGELMILIATIFWSVEHVIAKQILKDVDPDIVITARMLFGSIILIISALCVQPYAFNQLMSLSGQQLFWLIATAATLLGYVMTWYRAIKYAPIISVATILVASTLVTNLLSALFITHTWNASLTYQAVLILGALSIFILEPNKDKKHVILSQTLK